MERSPFTSTEVMKPLNHSSHCYFCNSAQYLRSNSRPVQRTVQSIICGAVTDLCKELDPNSRNQTEGEICESLVIPTEIHTADATSQSSTSLAQGDLLQEYEREFEELPSDQKLSKLCSDAGLLKETGKGQFFITIRTHTTSKSGNIPTEKVDSFEYENRPSPGCKTQSSRKTLLC